jgi:muconolactone delta-isomerase
MQYLVSATGGPAFTTPAESLTALEDMVLPLFDSLMRWSAEKKILAGGVPVGNRAMVFIAEAASHGELDRMLRSLPMWSRFTWEVTPLETFAGRAAQEREFVQRLAQALGRKK